MMAAASSFFEIVIDPPRRHSANITALKFKGNRLISGAADGLILIWDLSDYSPKIAFNSHNDQISRLIVDHDEIIASSWDKSISIINLETLSVEKLQTTFKGAVYTTELIASKDIVVTSSEGREVRLIEKPTGKIIKVMRGHREEVTSVSVSPSGKTLATGSWDGTIKLWDIQGRKLLATLSAHESEISAVKFVTEKLLASGSWDGKILLWNVEEKTVQGKLEGHHNMITAIETSEDGNLLVSGSSDKTLRTWELKTLKPIAKYEGHKGRIYAIALSENNIVASGGTDKAIHLWNAKTGEVIEVLEGDENHVFQVFLAPTAEFVRIVYSAGKELYVDMKTLKHVEKPDVPFLHHQKIQSVKPVFLGRSGVSIRFIKDTMTSEQASVAYLALTSVLEKPDWLQIGPNSYAKTDSLEPDLKNGILLEIEAINQQLKGSIETVTKQ